MKPLHDSLLEAREAVIEQSSNLLCEAIRSGEVNEGVLASLVGGLAGLTAGSSLMKAICKSLGVDHGLLYDLLTSKIICAAAGAALANSFGK